MFACLLSVQQTLMPMMLPFCKVWHGLPNVVCFLPTMAHHAHHGPHNDWHVHCFHFNYFVPLNPQTWSFWKCVLCHSLLANPSPIQCVLYTPSQKLQGPEVARKRGNYIASLPCTLNIENCQEIDNLCWKYVYNICRWFNTITFRMV